MPILPGMSLPDAPRRWSTADVPAAQRLDFWVGAISENFLAMDADGDRRDFRGELSTAALGAVGVNQVRADPQRVWRTPRGIARSPEQHCYLLGDLARPWRVAQDGREALMQPGDFVLVDSRRPYSFAFDQGPDCVSLELPLAWVARWLAEPEAHTAQPFRAGCAGCAGWGGALAAFARPWRPAMALQPPLPAALLTDQLGAMLALACGGGTLAGSGTAPTPGRRNAANALQARASALLHERLAEPGLSAADVAQALGCSVRSLHRAMAAQSSTFAQQLMAARMGCARQMLASPALRQVPAGEIGRRVGLLDPSHFARLCRRWLGAPPSALRGQ